MMLSDTEARIRYLIVGFFAQRVLDALVRCAETGDAPEFDTTMKTAIRELQAATGTQPEDRRDIRAFSNYEQIRTLDEVRSQVQVRNMIRVLTGLLERRNAKDPASVQRGLDEAIDFFSQLESQALRNFDQPVESLPSGLRELCTAS
jgi:hypothetical protein